MNRTAHVHIALVVVLGLALAPFGAQAGEPLDIVGSAYFCGSLPTTVIPPKATHMDIEIGDRIEDEARPCGTTTAGTWGAVVAIFN